MEQSKAPIWVSMDTDLDLYVMATVLVLRDLQDEAGEPDTVVVAYYTLKLFAKGILQVGTCPRNKHAGSSGEVANSAL
jgi:hypothetical protein